MMMQMRQCPNLVMLDPFEDAVIISGSMRRKVENNGVA